MAQAKTTRKEKMIEVSPEAKHFWGKKIEDALPKPTVFEDVSLMNPSDLLLDMLQYARGANSRGEWLFRKNYLHPIFDHYEQLAENTSWEEDDMGNMYVYVGEPNAVLHVGHVDTVHDDDHSPLQDIKVTGNTVTLEEVVKHSVPSMTQGVRFVQGVDVKYDYINYSLPPKKMRCLGADSALYVVSDKINHYS